MCAPFVELESQSPSASSNRELHVLIAVSTMVLIVVLILNSTRFTLESHSLTLIPYRSRLARDLKGAQPSAAGDTFVRAVSGHSCQGEVVAHPIVPTFSTDRLSQRELW